MIYTINIVTDTRKGDAYDKVAINKWPIIYKTSKSPDEFIYSTPMISQLQALIKNDTTRNKASLYVRALHDDMTYDDYEYSVKEILEHGKTKET